MHYQAVLCICFISEVLHVAVHLVIESDNHGKAKVCSPWDLLFYHKMQMCFTFAEKAKIGFFFPPTCSFKGNWLLFATTQEKRQDVCW